MRLFRTTPPTDDPLTVASALEFLRADPAEVGLVAELIASAVERVEKDTGRALMLQTWTMWRTRWSDDRLTSDVGQYERATALPFRTSGGRYIKIPKAPLHAVTSVQYYDAAETLQIMPSSDYVVLPAGEASCGGIWLKNNKSWPDVADRPDAIQIVFQAGAEEAEDVPKSLQQAMRLIVAHYYEQRTPVNVGNIVTEIPMGVRDLLISERLEFVA